MSYILNTVQKVVTEKVLEVDRRNDKCNTDKKSYPQLLHEK